MFGLFKKDPVKKIGEEIRQTHGRSLYPIAYQPKALGSEIC